MATETKLSAPTQGTKDIQLYSLATPNGKKVALALEEMNIPYDAHTIDIRTNVQFQDWFVKICPNSKIPTIVDIKGPNGQSVPLFESGAILLYLAHKYDKEGKFLPLEPLKRATVVQWMFWQAGGLGPNFGQLNHFYRHASEQIPYAKKRFFDETKRLLTVLDKQLSDKKCVAGDEYSLADMMIFPWCDSLNQAPIRPELGSFPNVDRWIGELKTRPAVERAWKVNAFS